jgi:hypothetical protein
MKKKDFIPRSDGDFDPWQENLINKVDPVAGPLGIPEARITATHTKQARWAKAYKATEDPGACTKVAVLEKNEAREDYEADLRDLNNSYLMHNPAMTDIMREQMGLPIHKTTRTPAQVAKTYPDFDIDSSIIRCLIIHFYDQGQKKSKAKPEGQHGAEIRWAISDTPVVDVSKLINSVFDTHTPFTLEFEGHERGQTVYFCLRWENTRGLKGHWSEIQSAIIP